MRRTGPGGAAGHAARTTPPGRSSFAPAAMRDAPSTPRPRTACGHDAARRDRRPVGTRARRPEGLPRAVRLLTLSGLLALAGLLALGIACQPATDMETTTQTLHIALQDGFDDEPVVVLVGGEEVLRRDAVRTDPRIGLAYAFEVPLHGPDAVTVEVRLPRRGVEGATEVVGATAVHLAVSVRDGALVFRTSEVPFGYV